MAKKNEIRLEYKDAKSAKQYTIWMEKEGDNWDDIEKKSFQWQW